MKLVASGAQEGISRTETNQEGETEDASEKKTSFRILSGSLPPE